MAKLLLLILAVMVSFPSVQRGVQASPPQAKASDPTEHHRTLETLAGSWNVNVTFKLAPGVERSGKAVCEIRSVFGGRFIKQEYKTLSGGVPFTVIQYLGYDNIRKKTFEVKFDSNDTGVQFTEGTASSDGRIFTNIGLRTDPQTGKVRILRTVLTIAGPDSFVIEWYQTGDDGKEEKVVTLSHTRSVT